jgi:uncharacterized membrane protein
MPRHIPPVGASVSTNRGYEGQQPITSAPWRALLKRQRAQGEPRCDGEEEIRLQWLRKAILRAGRYQAFRDEEALYRAELANAQVAKTTLRAGMDWYAFTLAFKGVFLEGLEVAFIVLAFGTSQGSIPLAALGAGIALVLVVVVAAMMHQPLSRVPENTMKFAVGLMLATFGIFWSVEGTGVAWPGADAALLGIFVFLTLVSLGLVAVLRRIYARQALIAANAAEMGE